MTKRAGERQGGRGSIFDLFQEEKIDYVKLHS